MLHDVLDESATESTYECLGCGNIKTSKTHPGKCKKCGGSFQNRAMSLE